MASSACGQKRKYADSSMLEARFNDQYFLRDRLMTPQEEKNLAEQRCMRVVAKASEDKQ